MDEKGLLTSIHTTLFYISGSLLSVGSAQLEINPRRKKCASFWLANSTTKSSSRKSARSSGQPILIGRSDWKAVPMRSFRRVTRCGVENVSFVGPACSSNAFCV